jgi:hypothetical protein
MFTGACKMVGSILRAACREFWHFDRGNPGFPIGFNDITF